MNIAISGYDIPADESGNIFEQILIPLIDAVKMEIDINHIPRLMIANMLPNLRKISFMAFISVKYNIPVRQEVIERLRMIYKYLDAGMDKSIRIEISEDAPQEFEKIEKRLAIAISILDIANDPGIQALFEERKADS